MIINENAQELYPADARTETGPGELLSRKREALGVTHQQVAAELHITMHYVRALEENAFEKLPGDVFVRGYIRAYAGFLKLDPQVLINVFNEYSGKKVVQYEISATKAKRRRDKNLPWIIVSGVAFIVIAVGLWYFGSSGVPAPTPTPGAAIGGQTQRPAAAAGSTIESANANVRFPAAAPVASSVTPPVASPFTPPVAPPALDGLQQVPATLPGQLTTPAQAVPAQPVLTTPAPSNAGQALPAPTAPIQTTPQQSSPVPASSPSANPVLPTPTPTPTPTPSTPSGGPQQPAQGSTIDDVARVINVDAGGEDVVQITFNGNSHVQVDDGNDTQIYNDMQEAGDVVLISGSAPFDILLGDASTTELRLNGSKVDFSSSIRIDNSARLTIGL
jgi:cytoskeleton protein RodZ